jgi:hypothetical protein
MRELIVCGARTLRRPLIQRAPIRRLLGAGETPGEARFERWGRAVGMDRTSARWSPARGLAVGFGQIIEQRAKHQLTGRIRESSHLRRVAGRV